MNSFSEIQRFRLKWAWAGVIAVNGLFIYAIVQQVILGKPFGNKPASDLVLILLEIIPLLLLLFILSKKTGNAFNTSESCKTGLQLQFKDGRLLLIGTKNPAAIQEIVEAVIAAGKINRNI